MKKTAPKFKEGDRVIYKPNTSYEDTGVVIEVYEGFLYCLWDSDRQRQTCSINNVELEYVCNSPLWKALS